MKPILQFSINKQDLGEIVTEPAIKYTVEGFVFNEPVIQQGANQMFTKFELGVDGRLVNTLYSPVQHTKESLEAACKKMFDAKSLFE